MRCKIPLSEIAEIVMGQSPIKSDVNSSGNGVALLNGPTEFGSRYPSPVQYTTNGKRFSEKGDILFCVRGSTTGRMNYSDQQYAIGRGLAAIRGKNGIPTPVVKAIIENRLPALLQAATGSTFPNVSKDLLNTFQVEMLTVKDAVKLNSLITSMEDKLFNNTLMNQILEKIAQRIFKSWFIDFDPVKANAEGVPFADLSPDIQSLFPSEFIESEMGLIPKGWEVKSLSDFSEVVSKGTTPTKSDMAAAMDTSDIQYHKVRDHFGVNVMAQHAALAALADQKWLEQVSVHFEAARKHIAAIATANGLAPLPSATNFVTIDCGRDGDYALRVLKELNARDVFIRKPGAPGIDRCIRVSCGLPHELDYFEAALPEALKAAE